MPCTAWADQKWSTIPRSYLIGDRSLEWTFGNSGRLSLWLSA
ncbi:hypothetical protein [Sodalis sp. (in: enterobacteria)]